VAGGVFLDELGEGVALVLERQEEGETYQTWIYRHNGYLQEFFIKKGSDIDPDFGESIMPINTFSVTEENGLFHISTTDRDGNPVSVRVSPRTM
jgi:predicted glutamine amidotransferase